MLNHAVGGLNATAVEVAARQGARIVWLPTVSATGEVAKVEGADPDGNVPVWVRFERELRAAGAAPAPVPVLDADGAPLPELLAVLGVVARRGLVLATGHLSRAETFAVVDAAVAAGVETIVVTNPEFPSHKLSPDDQVALAERGALFQRALTTPYTGKCTWDELFAATRAVGCRADGLGQRPRASVQPAGRRRPGPPGRPLPRRRLQRGGDPDHGGREHAEAGRCLSGCR